MRISKRKLDAQRVGGGCEPNEQAAEIRLGAVGDKPVRLHIRYYVSKGMEAMSFICRSRVATRVISSLRWEGIFLFSKLYSGGDMYVRRQTPAHRFRRD